MFEDFSGGRAPPERRRRGPWTTEAGPSDHVHAASSVRSIRTGYPGSQVTRPRRRHTAAVAAGSEYLADLQFRRAVERLHRLGPRQLYELLAALGANRLIRVDIEREVEGYGALDPDIVRQLGGDRFPPSPLHRVERRE